MNSWYPIYYKYQCVIMNMYFLVRAALLGILGIHIFIIWGWDSPLRLYRHGVQSGLMDRSPYRGVLVEQELPWQQLPSLVGWVGMGPPWDILTASFEVVVRLFSPGVSTGKQKDHSAKSLDPSPVAMCKTLQRNTSASCDPQQRGDSQITARSSSQIMRWREGEKFGLTNSVTGHLIVIQQLYM